MRKKTSPKLRFIKALLPKKKKEKQKIIGIENALQILKAKRSFAMISICAIIAASLAVYYPTFFKTKAVSQAVFTQNDWTGGVNPNSITTSSSGWNQISSAIGANISVSGQASIQQNHWSPNGNPVVAADSAQYESKSIPDGFGGSIIIWSDYRSGNDLDIYAQRIDVSGNNLWGANGVVINNPADITNQGNDQSAQYAGIISDGSGGAIVSWNDNVLGLMAQRIDANGNPVWGTGGIVIVSQSVSQWPGHPSLASDGLGGAMIVWHDHRNDQVNWTSDIYLQKVDANGAIGFAVNGVPISEAINSQSDPKITESGGKFYVIWDDNRSGNWDIYAQKLELDGTRLWGSDLNGIKIASEINDTGNESIINDGQGGFIVTWGSIDSNYSDQNYFSQKYDPDGNKVWSTAGSPNPDGVAISNEPVYKNHVELISDGLGGAFYAWEDGRGGGWGLFAQRITNAGVLWDPAGVIVTNFTSTSDWPSIAMGFPGEMLAVWTDERVSSYVSAVYSQKLNPDGQRAWDAGGGDYNGLKILKSINSYDPRIVSDGLGGGIISWNDYRINDRGDYFAQRISNDGQFEHYDNIAAADFSNSDVECDFGSTYDYPHIVADGVGGSVVVARCNYNIYTQRFDSNNQKMWGDQGVLLGSSGDTPKVIKSGNSFIVLWNSSPYLYAQKILADGTLDPGWGGVGGILVSSTGVGANYYLAPDDNGGFVATWSYNDDIYAKGIDASGNTIWGGVNGLVICNAANTQWYPKIINSGSGYFYIAWVDQRVSYFESNIYVQKIDATNGDIKWTVNGVPVSGANFSIGDNNQPLNLVPDNQGGLFIAYSTKISGNYNINLQRLNGDGNIPTGSWGANGIQLVSGPNSASEPDLITYEESGSIAGVIVSWLDYRGSYSYYGNVYAQKVNLAGDIQWNANGNPVAYYYGSLAYNTIESDGAGGALSVFYAYDNNGVMINRIKSDGTIDFNGFPYYLGNGGDIEFINVGNNSYMMNSENKGLCSSHVCNDKFTMPSTQAKYLNTAILSSSIFDAGSSVNWDTISWSVTTPANTTISVKTRSSVDNVVWSPWSSPVTSSDSTITSPAGQYIQYQVTLSTTDSGVTPSITSISISASSAPVNPAYVSGLVTSAGATLTTPDTNASITVPAGALSTDTTISVDGTGSNFMITGPFGIYDGLTSYEFSPDGLTFDSPVTITLKLDKALLDSLGYAISDVHVFSSPDAGNTWADHDNITATGVSGSSYYVTFTTAHFSRFALGHFKATPSAYTYLPANPSEQEVTSEPVEEIKEENPVLVNPNPVNPNPINIEVCADNLTKIQLSPIPPFNPTWGVGYPGGRVNWALEHRKNIFYLYVIYLKRQPCATEVNWFLQHDNNSGNIKHQMLISEEYALKNR